MEEVNEKEGGRPSKEKRLEDLADILATYAVRHDRFKREQEHIKRLETYVAYGEELLWKMEDFDSFSELTSNPVFKSYDVAKDLYDNGMWSEFDNTKKRITGDYNMLLQEMQLGEGVMKEKLGLNNVKNIKELIAFKWQMKYSTVDRIIREARKDPEAVVQKYLRSNEELALAKDQYDINFGNFNYNSGIDLFVEQQDNFIQMYGLKPNIEEHYETQTIFSGLWEKVYGFFGGVKKLFKDANLSQQPAYAQS